MSKFLGLKLDLLTMEETISKCEQLIRERNKQHVVLNAAKVVAAIEKPELAEIINRCDLVNADGMAVVWAARALGLPVPERVSGIDLMERIVDLSASKGYSIYLLGAEQRILEATQEIFISRGAKVVGARNGYWSFPEESKVVATIASLQPDILFLAVPSPKKEIFLSQHLTRLNTGLVFGVGGSFDVVAGLTKRAPAIFQRLGLEWAFRLAQEPRRMFKRYLVGNSKFVLIVTKAVITRFILKEKN